MWRGVLSFFTWTDGPFVAPTGPDSSVSLPFLSGISTITGVSDAEHITKLLT